jgi:hypothetical protein
VRLEDLLDRLHRRSSPDQHSHVSPLDGLPTLGGRFALKPLAFASNELGLGALVREQPEGHRTLTVGGMWLERSTRPAGLVDSSCDPVGDGEDARSRPEVLRQRDPLVALAVGARKVVGEADEVVHGGSPPGEDRLPRITNRGDRVPAPSECLQHSSLRDVRVLVFVEQHDRILLDVGLLDVRVVLEHGHGLDDLIAEVDALEVVLGLHVRVDRRAELPALG